MRESHLIQCAGAHLLARFGGLLARECRLHGGAGRADGLAIWQEASRVRVAVLEAKTAHELHALVPRRRGWFSDDAIGGVVSSAATPVDVDRLTDAERHHLAAQARVDAPALQQLARYAGDMAWLVSPAGALDEVPLTAAALAQVCVAEGVGWLSVDWYGEVTEHVAATARPLPALCDDALEAYARGDALRTALTAGVLPRSAVRVPPGPCPDGSC